MRYVEHEFIGGAHDGCILRADSIPPHSLDAGMTQLVWEDSTLHFYEHYATENGRCLWISMEIPDEAQHAIMEIHRTIL